MSTQRIRSIVEVVAVFILTVVAIWVVRISPLGEWERGITRRPFLEYAAMMAVPLWILKITGRNFAAYGVSLQRFRYHLEIALVCCIPYAVAHAITFGVKLSGVTEAMLYALLAVAALVSVGLLLRRKPSLGSVAALIAPLTLLPIAGLAWNVNVPVVLSSFVFYGLFLGPGEEILFRGFIQSRLNESFPRSWVFFGVQWGWGTLFCALLFGLFHLLNLPALLEGRVVPLWGLGISTFFWGLFFGFIREKTGSVVAPALVHGVPQAIALAFSG